MFRVSKIYGTNTHPDVTRAVVLSRGGCASLWILPKLNVVWLQNFLCLGKRFLRPCIQEPTGARSLDLCGYSGMSSGLTKANSENA